MVKHAGSGLTALALAWLITNEVHWGWEAFMIFLIMLLWGAEKDDRIR